MSPEHAITFWSSVELNTSHLNVVEEGEKDRRGWGKEGESKSKTMKERQRERKRESGRKWEKRREKVREGKWDVEKGIDKEKRKD